MRTLHMSFFTWFSGKSHPAKSVVSDEKKRALTGGHKPVVLLPQRPVPEEANPREDRKVKRHARREQLYVAIREAMTRAGVLSARYKFKVLSLDQPGDNFLVMIDLATASGVPPEQFSEMEALIVHNAQARFQITVPAVYWRLDEVAALPKPETSRQSAAREPIQVEEIVAFKQALRAASVLGPKALPEKGGQIRSAAHSYTLLTGFEDTEMPESPSSPALSSTQYGDLT